MKKNLKKEKYKAAKDADGGNYKQFRPSVQLTKKDKQNKRINLKRFYMEDLEED